MYSEEGTDKREERYKRDFEAQTNLKKDSLHHIKPKSRGGTDEDSIMINEKLHQKYHTLFLNRTQEEILDFLTEYFWGGDLEAVKNFLEQKEQEQYKLVSNCY